MNPHNISLFCMTFLMGGITLVPSLAQAGPDTFGQGNGQDGALNVTTASTIINAYTGVTTAVQGATTLDVEDASSIQVGDLIMVWQTSATLATPPASGDQAAIDLASVGVGHWEFARVTAVAGTTVTVSEALLHTYQADGGQVITVPEYTSVDVADAASITAPDWDGNSGGIVVMLSQGDITLTGTAEIDVTGKGFRGGQINNDGGIERTGCTALDGISPENGEKGEGILFDFYGIAHGARGNRASGAGGANCHNAGGGGGGHGGTGGAGGLSWGGDGSRDVGGLGGASLTYDFNGYLSFGGGGGSGHQNNSVGSDGGDGGGAILLRASSLLGTGSLIADGLSAADVGNDGAGGGGAGGAIALDMQSNVECFLASVKGGNGGSNSTNDHGTGGGGAGGRFFSSAVSNLCIPDIANGTSGTLANGDPYGATPEVTNEPAILGTVSLSNQLCTVNTAYTLDEIIIGPGVSGTWSTPTPYQALQTANGGASSYQWSGQFKRHRDRRNQGHRRLM